MEYEKSLFLELLGDSPLLRILDFLLEGRELDYPKKEIAENSNVSWNTLEKIWPHLIYKGFVIKTRKIGKQELFKLNLESELVKRLAAFDDSLIKYSLTTHATNASKVKTSKAVFSVESVREGRGSVH